MRIYTQAVGGGDGTRLPESSGRWQLPSECLRKAAALAQRSTAPFGHSAENELAGSLHDLSDAQSVNPPRCSSRQNLFIAS